MTLLLELSLALAQLGQAPAAAEPNPPSPELSAARLAYMKKTVLSYDIRPADDPKTSFRLEPEPVLRFTNPVGRARDGTVFLWFDESGRPAVVVQATLNLRGFWIHEFSSLSPAPFTARSDQGQVWSPSTGGVSLLPVPDAPRPADTAPQRLAQLRALAREFAVEDNFERRGWQPLRLLPKTFARYGKEGSGVLDGALFCYALTTDPEAYLVLEARAGKDGAAWHYGFAPSTGYPLRASRKGTTVWERNIERTEGGPNRTLYQFPYSSESITAGPNAP